jgi:multidrug resistance protein, MATE family
MTSNSAWNTHWKNVLKIGALAWPIFVGQLATVSNVVIDTAMNSRASAVDLAAFSVSMAVYLSVFVGLNGIAQALSPSIGQLFGAGRFAEIGKEFKQGIWLGILLATIGCLILIFPQPILAITNSAPELTDKVAHFLQIIAIALPATLGFRIYSALTNAISRPKMVMIIQVCCIALKFPLNYLFIFGGFGIPPMGVIGCAVATVIVSWLMLIAACFALKYERGYQQFQLLGGGFVAPDWKVLRNLLRLGIPMGASYLIEVTSFTLMALLIARLGAINVAGHQLAANLVTILYMLPMSIAIATCTLTAQAIGANQYALAKRTGNAGLLFAALTALPIAITIWLARDMILRAYTSNEVIIAAALPIFVFIPLYHFFDAIQVTLAYPTRLQNRGDPHRYLRNSAMGHWHRRRLFTRLNIDAIDARHHQRCVRILGCCECCKYCRLHRTVDVPT